MALGALPSSGQWAEWMPKPVLVNWLIMGLERRQNFLPKDFFSRLSGCGSACSAEMRSPLSHDAHLMHDATSGPLLVSHGFSKKKREPPLLYLLAQPNRWKLLIFGGQRERRLTCMGTVCRQALTSPLIKLDLPWLSSREKTL